MKNLNLRKKILELVKQYYKQEFDAKKEFIPGKSNIVFAGRVFDSKELINLVDASLDFWLTEGRFTKEFEEKFSNFLDVHYTILTNSGSSANLLAVSSLTSPLLGKKRLKPGDEVITIAASFPTTINPIIQNQLVPIFLDIDLENYNINTKLIEKAITKKTKAIFVAHTLGNPFDLNAITKLAKKYQLFLIEDCCDALGSKYNNKIVGSFGDIATFSFYPAHHITCGEGGALTTNDPLFQRIIRSYRDWGRDCWCKSGHDNTCGRRFNQKLGDLPYGYDHKYIYSNIGYNLKATDMQAAILIPQLEKLPTFIQKRKDNFQKITEIFEKYQQYFILPKPIPHSDPSWFGFLITIKDDVPFKREQLVKFLEDNKIATRMLFAGNITRQPAYYHNPFINYKIPFPLTNTDKVMNDTFWIGVYPGITSQMIDYIEQIINQFMKKYV